MNAYSICNIKDVLGIANIQAHLWETHFIRNSGYTSTPLRKVKFYVGRCIFYCVLNALLTISAIIFNIRSQHRHNPFQAARETSSFPLKRMILSLSDSNLGVGLLFEPFYIDLLIKLLQRDNLSEAACLPYLVLP